MIRFIHLLTLLFCSSVLSAQIKFVQGYYIDNLNQKHVCYLTNPGMESKGEDFIYKIHEDSLSHNFEISRIKEFGILNEFRYTRHKIRVDVSGNKIKNLKDTVSHRQIQSGHAFLLEIINSELASLYCFFFAGREYFFYQKGHSKLQELVYKRYDVEEVPGYITKVLYNKSYQKQLEVDLPCSANAKSVAYTTKSLTKYLNKYLDESGERNRGITDNKKGKMHINLAGIYNYYTFHAQEGDLRYLPFEQVSNFGYGIEAEYLFRFNRNKFGVFVEVAYNNCSTSYLNGTSGDISTLDYKFMEFPIGISYRFNLSNDFKLLLKGGVVPNLLFKDSQLFFYHDKNTYQLNSATCGVLSFGVNYKRLKAEFRVYSKRDVTQHIFNRNSEFGQSSMRLSYTVFDF